jgi:hypothetical protein
MTQISGGFEIGGTVADVAFVAFVLTVIALTVVVLARPWELRGGRLADKLRIADAVTSYDFWLSLKGVGGRRRRELRADLRANLWDATQRVGAKQAVAAIGPTRRLAAESVATSSAEVRRPRWGFGLAAGLVAVEVFVMLQIALTTVVVDTAEALGASRVDVPVTMVPGMRAGYEAVPDGGFTVTTSFGPAPLVVGLVAFVLVARPWALLRRRTPVAA